jgi:MSHA biogenesis protein MshQ
VFDTGGSGDQTEGESNDGSPAFPGAARLDILAPSTASVCAPADITIRAYDANGELLTDYEGVVGLSSTSGHGLWGTVAANGTLSPDPDLSDDGRASYQFDQGDNGTVTLNLSNTHADRLRVRAEDAAANVVQTSDPIRFLENILRISPDDPLGDDLIAGRNHQFRADLIKRDDSGECGIAEDYQGTYELQAWLERTSIDPGGQGPRLSSGTVLDPVPDASGNGGVEIEFVDGTGLFTLLARDVGDYTLKLQDSVSGYASALDGTPLSIPSTSATAPWTARPFSIAMDVSGNPAAQNAGGPAFIAAGEEFTIRLGGALYDSADDSNGDGVADDGANLMDNDFAPSFGQEGEQVTVTSDLFAPAAGAEGDLSGADPVAGDFSGGEGNSVEQPSLKWVLSV